MSTSPFQYGTVVSRSAFINRTVELDRLLKNFDNGINTIIISPRRWGKSSLVEKAVGIVNDRHSSLQPVLIDLFSVSSEEEFLELFAREVIRSSDTKWENWIKTAGDAFKHLTPKFTVGTDPFNEFSISFDWKELRKNKDEILNLPETLALKKGIKFVVCLDEFQNLASFSSFESLEKNMRAVWQRQKNVSFCLFGSKRHMMQDLFNNSSKPFYRFGDMMLLDKIKESDWIHFIVRSFKDAEKEISSQLAEKIAKSMNNHSWYVQQLANYVWQNTNDKADDRIVESAIKEVVNANLPLFQKEVEMLSKTQLNLLRAIANGETQLTSTRVMRNYKIGTPRNVDKNKTILKSLDIIDESGKKIQFLDPVFELWFKKIFS